MLDLLQNLFGGSETSSKPTDMTPDQFKDLRDPFSAALSSYLTTGGPSYTGPLYSPATANENQLLGGLMTQTGDGTQRQGYLNNVLGGNFLPGQPGGNPFLDAAIKAAQRPTMEGLEETLSRSLPGRFTANGQFTNPQGSSAFDRAAAIATRGAAQASADIATNMSNTNYNTERDRQQQAVALDQQEVDATIKNLQAQALPRMIQELGIERGMTLFQTKTSQLLDFLKLLGGVTAPTIANESSGQSQGSAFSALFPKGLGGGGDAAKVAVGA